MRIMRGEASDAESGLLANAGCSIVRFTAQAEMPGTRGRHLYVALEGGPARAG